MRRKVLFSFFGFICLVLFWTLVPVGCASIAPPTGGPRDSIPPRLVKISPADSTRNFKGKVITLTFDEFVDIKDRANNFVFTPTFTIEPRIEANLRTVTIEFKEPLDSATTYVLHLGNAIVDINEGNALKDFSYIFSTGPTLDSLEIKGKVVLAETGGVDSTLQVVLHRKPSDTSAIRNKMPRYLVKLNKAGEFSFRHLPSDTFAIYALGNNLKMYNNEYQMFAFSNQPVISGQTDSVVLYAYEQSKKKTAAGNALNIPGVNKPAAGDRRLRINFPPAEQDLRTDYVLTFNTALSSFDSTKINLTTDSLFTPTSFSAELDSTNKIVNIKSPWKENTKYNLELQKDFATDSSGRQLLKTDTLFFVTKKTSDYGNITLRFNNLDSTLNPVLQIIHNDQVIITTSIKSGSFSRSLFDPGEYSLRILYDKNDNGKWDPGNFSERKQPELVRPLNKAITIKPAWDNQFDIDL